MTRSRRWIAAAAVAVAVTGGGAGLAVANGGDDDDGGGAITGGALERASAAALAHTGGGRVTETEVGDEESYYEVEVTLAGGGQVDVQLDRDFNVVGSEADIEGPDDGADEGEGDAG